MEVATQPLSVPDMAAMYLNFKGEGMNHREALNAIYNVPGHHISACDWNAFNSEISNTEWAEGAKVWVKAGTKWHVPGGYSSFYMGRVERVTPELVQDERMWFRYMGNLYWVAKESISFKEIV